MNYSDWYNRMCRDLSPQELTEDPSEGVCTEGVTTLSDSRKEKRQLDLERVEVLEVIDYPIVKAHNHIIYENPLLQELNVRYTAACYSYSKPEHILHEMFTRGYAWIKIEDAVRLGVIENIAEWGSTSHEELFQRMLNKLGKA